MNRKILHIALPSIVSNITVPLLALVDTTIVGHLGAAAYIGAIAIGGMIFNMIYWLFSFLRMGTGGLTAQAYGANNSSETNHILMRSLAIALGPSLFLILLQGPILYLTFGFVQASAEVRLWASVYFKLLIWGAPAVLGLYSFVGWFLGMQNTRVTMFIAIVQNVVNIIASMLFVFVFKMKVEGVALGTLIAQYAGLLMAFVIWFTQFHHKSGSLSWYGVFSKSEMLSFFNVNRDIFLRTLCLIAVTTYFTSAGSAQGELTLAANTLLMQFFIIFSYVMDGFAYAGEALGGRYCGARDMVNFKRLAHHLFVFGAALAVLFSLAYVGGGSHLLHLLTNDEAVVVQAQHYLLLASVIPLLSFAAFLFDGLYVGTTSTRYMLMSMFFASLSFFIVVKVFPLSNFLLWTAFLVYLGGRGLMQCLLFKHVLKRVVDK